MFAIVSFVVGLAGGAAGTAAWLLSEPGESTPVPESLGDRLETVKSRLDEAMAEGKRAGAETENRLRLELEAYRRGSDRPGASPLR
jgi:hypothetical protein